MCRVVLSAGRSFWAALVLFRALFFLEKLGYSPHARNIPLNCICLNNLFLSELIRLSCVNYKSRKLTKISCCLTWVVFRRWCEAQDFCLIAFVISGCQVIGRAGARVQKRFHPLLIGFREVGEHIVHDA